MSTLSQGRVDAKPPLSHREGCTDSVWRLTHRSPLFTVMESVRNSTRMVMHAVECICKFTKRLLLRPSVSRRSHSVSQCALKVTAKAMWRKFILAFLVICVVIHVTSYVDVHLVYLIFISMTFKSVNLLAI